MKKLLLTVLVALFAVPVSIAQTAEEVKASAARIETLMAAAPEKCGIEGIDNLVDKCKSLAGSTASLGTQTSKLNGRVSAAQSQELNGKLNNLKVDYEKVSGQLKEAISSLKELKNPLKIKAASKGIEYAEGVVADVGKELTYQKSVISGLLHQ